MNEEELQSIRDLIILMPLDFTLECESILHEDGKWTKGGHDGLEARYFMMGGCPECGWENNRFICEGSYNFIVQGLEDRGFGKFECSCGALVDVQDVFAKFIKL